MKKKNRRPDFLSAMVPFCLPVYRLVRRLPVWNDKAVEGRISRLKPTGKKQLEQQVTMFRCRQIAVVLLAVAASAGAGVLLMMKDAVSGTPDEEAITIERNSYGETSSEEELVVTVDGQDAEELTLKVQPREYTEKQLEQKFQEAMDLVEDGLKGENRSLDRVWKPLSMPSGLPGSPIEIRWLTDQFHLIHNDGTVLADGISSPTVVNVTAIYSYGEEEKSVTYPVCVVRPKRTEKEKELDAITEKLQKQEEISRQEETFSLPKKIGSAVVSLKEEKKKNYGRIVFLGLMTGIFLAVKQQEELKQKGKERERAFLLEYPEFVRQLSLLLGAGMTMKSAFAKLACKYDPGAENGGAQPVYEEIAIANRQMEQGISPADALEQWGNRIGLSLYRKLANLMTQNMAKGNAGLVSMLEQEELTAMEHRRQMAKKLGEEAGTKLLIPMAALLVVTILLILTPALIRFQM